MLPSTDLHRKACLVSLRCSCRSVPFSPDSLFKHLSHSVFSASDPLRHCGLFFVKLPCCIPPVDHLMLTLQKNKLWKMCAERRKTNAAHNAPLFPSGKFVKSNKLQRQWLRPALSLHKPCFSRTVNGVNGAGCHNNTVSGQSHSGAVWISLICVCAAAVAQRGETATVSLARLFFCREHTVRYYCL